MLKNITIVISLFFSLTAMACWKLEGKLSVDGEDWKIHQKVDHGKEYSLPMGSFILNFSLNTLKKQNIIKYSLFEKKGIKTILVTKGSDNLEVSKTKEIYAKGEENQPNSILSLKLSDI